MESKKKQTSPKKRNNEGIKVNAAFAFSVPFILLKETDNFSRPIYKENLPLTLQEEFPAGFDTVFITLSFINTKDKEHAAPKLSDKAFEGIVSNMLLDRFGKREN